MELKSIYKLYLFLEVNSTSLLFILGIKVKFEGDLDSVCLLFSSQVLNNDGIHSVDIHINYLITDRHIFYQLKLGFCLKLHFSGLLSLSVLPFLFRFLTNNILPFVVANFIYKFFSASVSLFLTSLARPVGLNINKMKERDVTAWLQQQGPWLCKEILSTQSNYSMRCFSNRATFM